MVSKASKKTKPDIDTNAAVQALEYLFAAGYINKKRLYFENFVRGLFFSFGSVVGATIVIALLLWILSFFDGLPWVGDVVRSIQNSINQ